MTKTQFTPGPWKWEEEGSPSWPSYSLSPGVLLSDLTDGTPWGDDIDCANASLIAAAPDLYEALEAAANSAGFQYMWPNTRSKIEAALAKARGEA